MDIWGQEGGGWRAQTLYRPIVSDRCIFSARAFQILVPLYNGLFRYFSEHLFGISKTILLAVRLCLCDVVPFG